MYETIPSIKEKDDYVVGLTKSIMDPNFEIKSKKETINFNVDEFPRHGTSFEKINSLKPVFKKDGSVSAGNASGLNDGSAAVVLMKESKANELNIKPLARVVSWATVGVDPSIMGIGPVPAVKKALEIAMDHLKSSFDIKKSVGYTKWLNKDK